MAWNEPGGGQQNPWGRNGDQGPPDLDELVRKVQQRFSGVFGGGRGGDGAGAGRASGPGIGLIVGVLALLWAASGIYIVDEGERGVVLRFGKYVETTLPGPHWHIPYPVESVETVNVDKIRSVQVGERPAEGRRPQVGKKALMLTQDENIVDIELAVQYRVKEANDYLFNVRDPDATVLQTAESAVRESIGKNKMDFIITEGREAVVTRTWELIQEILDRYQAGIQVVQVSLLYAQPPEEVKEAFDDAIKAREDEQTLKNQAEAYANEIIPKARGAAARQLEEANAYKESVIARAEGEASRFTQLLKEYERAPEVTRKRLYLDTLESVLGTVDKVVVDVQGGNNLLYLPLERLGARERMPLGEASGPSGSQPPAGSNATSGDRARSMLRRREVR